MVNQVLLVFLGRRGRRETWERMDRKEALACRGPGESPGKMALLVNLARQGQLARMAWMGKKVAQGVQAHLAHQDSRAPEANQD